MDITGWDIPNSASMLNKIQEAMEVNQSAMITNIRLENLAKEQQRQATIETARNTTEMKEDLKTIIHNQNSYIAMLESQNDYIKQVLNNIFGSSEDSIIVQKEILKIMQESKPTDGMIADKSLDVVIQLVFNAIKIYLNSNGIMI